MKQRWIYFVLLLLTAIVVLEVLQLRNIRSIQGGRSDKEGFLPMVYENQVYQASMTDGQDVFNPLFLTELRRRHVDRPVLVFRYSGLSCKACVQSCLNALRRLYPDFESNSRIVTVISDADPSQLLPNCVSLPAGETLGYDLEGTRIPHFFVYDSDRQQILHTFVPDQSAPNALRIYLNSIAGRYAI